jgi:hypothetical protein
MTAAPTEWNGGGRPADDDVIELGTGNGVITDNERVGIATPTDDERTDDERVVSSSVDSTGVALIGTLTTNTGPAPQAVLVPIITGGVVTSTAVGVPITDDDDAEDARLDAFRTARRPRSRRQAAAKKNATTKSSSSSSSSSLSSLSR